MDSTRLLAGVAALVLAGGSVVSATPTPLPAPAAGDSVARVVTARGSDSITLLPASPRGAVVGTNYTYTMPMCGAAGPIDVDGSFWDAAAGATGLDGRAGLFRLVMPRDAEFVSTEGLTIELARHEGAKTFRICS